MLSTFGRAAHLALALHLSTVSFAGAPMTLSDAWRAAESGGPSLALAEEEALAAAAGRGLAWSALSPRVTAGAAWVLNEREIAFDPAMLAAPGSPGNGLGPIVLQRKQHGEASVTARQALLSAPALSGIAAARWDAEAAILAARATRHQLRIEVAEAFYGVIVAREAERLSDQAADTAHRARALTDHRLALLEATPRDAAQAAVAVAEAERDALIAAERRVIAEERLRRLTGAPVDGELVAPPPTVAPDEVVDVLHRPDLGAARSTASAAAARRTTASLGWLPEIDARFTYAWTQNAGFTDDQALWSAAAEARWTLWDGGRQISATRQAAARARQAELAASRLEVEAAGDLHVARERALQTARALDVAEQAEGWAEENQQLALAALEAGSSTPQEVRDAELARRAAALAVVAGRAERALAVLELQLASGALPGGSATGEAE